MRTDLEENMRLKHLIFPPPRKDVTLAGAAHKPSPAQIIAAVEKLLSLEPYMLKEDPHANTVKRAAARG